MGSHVKVFAETGLLTRTGSRVAERIVLMRARVLCLPRDHPVRVVVDAAVEAGTSTWWEDAHEVMWEVGVATEVYDINTIAVGETTKAMDCKIQAASSAASNQDSGSTVVQGAAGGVERRRPGPILTIGTTEAAMEAITAVGGVAPPCGGGSDGGVWQGSLAPSPSH